jgi:hypothetical protein
MTRLFSGKSRHTLNAAFLPRSGQLRKGADQVAGTILPPAYTIKASDRLKKIGATHSKLTIERTDGTPLIMDVSKIKSQCDVIKYLDERDDFREEENKTRVWKGGPILRSITSSWAAPKK